MPGSFRDLLDQYQSFEEIINDPDLEAIAFAADMRPADFVNMAIKYFAITKGVLTQQVKIPIKGADGEVSEVALKHPTRGDDLKYSDYITDRSGPKFAGYLNDEEGKDSYQSLSPEERQKRDELKSQRLEEIKGKFQNVTSQKKIELAAQIFDRGHQTQRKLSDFDLTASNLQVFRDAVIKAISEPPTGVQLSPDHLELGKSIAETLWLVGGEVDVKIMTKCMANPNFIYRDEIQKTKPESHFLQNGPGKALFGDQGLLKGLGETELDRGYGLGVPFMGTEVRADPTGKLHLTSELVKMYNADEITKEELKKYFPGENLDDVIHHDGLYELGDIICDKGSIYQQVFTSEKNIQTTAQFESNQQFLADYSFAEESAKKEAQSIFFRERGMSEKEYGNVSDISPILKSIEDRSKSDNPEERARAEALREVVAHSLMIEAMRWGINVNNFEKIGMQAMTPEEKTVKVKAFQESINRRAYSYEPGAGGPRSMVGWSDISYEEAEKRWDNYVQCMQPIWKKVSEKKDYFTCADAYKKALIKQEKIIKDVAERELNGESIPPSLQAKKATVQHEVEALRSKLKKQIQDDVETDFPHLHHQMQSFEPNLDDSYRSLTEHAERGIEFGTKREKKLAEKEEALELAAREAVPQVAAGAAEAATTFSSVAAVAVASAKWKAKVKVKEAPNSHSRAQHPILLSASASTPRGPGDPLGLQTQLSIKRVLELLNEMTPEERLAQYHVIQYESKSTQPNSTPDHKDHLTIHMQVSDKTPVAVHAKQVGEDVKYSISKSHHALPPDIEKVIENLCKLAVDAAQPGTVFKTDVNGPHHDLVKKTFEVVLKEKFGEKYKAGELVIPKPLEPSEPAAHSTPKAH